MTNVINLNVYKNKKDNLTKLGDLTIVVWLMINIITSYLKC